jgi:RNA polymerase subunit RPABC4/transcription elongation factor Spt4
MQDTELENPCPRCGKREAEEWHDRFGIYSGKACDQCAHLLPGQGDTWDYEPDEPIEPEEPWEADDPGFMDYPDHQQEL